MPDPKARARAILEIKSAGERGDTLGGKILVVAAGVPPGLGSHVHWDRKLDARLALHFMSIQSVKAVEVGDGVAVSASYGRNAHDAILNSPETGFHHQTNRAGGVEGGMTNGEEIRVAAYLKPLATLMDPLPSVDLNTPPLV